MISQGIAITAILMSAHSGASPHFDVTAGPAKTAATPGATVQEKVWNYGNMPETISIGVNEIGHMANGSCGFTHAAPLAIPAYGAVHLTPGGSATIPVKVNPTGPAGYHAVTVDFTVAGSGNVKVSQGVATIIGVTYPGNSSATPCVTVAQTPVNNGGPIPPVVPLATGTAFLACLATLLVKVRRNRRIARAARVTGRHRAS